jgi:hypothetical protein
MSFAPIAFTTATDDRNVRSTIELASTLFKQAHTRVSTARLNQILEEVLDARGPGTRRGAKTPRIYYATQVGVSPPTLVFFVNHPDVSLPALRQRHQGAGRVRRQAGKVPQLQRHRLRPHPARSTRRHPAGAPRR